MYYICVLQKFRENQFHEFFFRIRQTSKIPRLQKKRKRKEKYLKSF